MPSSREYENALHYERFDSLEWLYNHGIRHSKYCVTHYIRYNKNDNPLPLLKWLHDHNTILCTSDISRFCIHGHLDVIKWTVDIMKIGLSVEYANRACENDQLEIVQWLAEKEIYPEDGAMRKASSRIVTFLYGKGIVYSDASVYCARACLEGNLKDLIIYEKIGYRPDDYGVTYFYYG